VVIGNGLTGTGETGPVNEDGVMRAATNAIDAAEDRWFAFSFSAPGDSGVTDLEGIGGPGDSGGPALAVTSGAPKVVGVSSINHVGSAAGPSRYHSTEVYARVSTSLGWIDETRAGRGTPMAHVDTTHNVSMDGRKLPRGGS
jgi:hypothetical protein